MSFGSGGLNQCSLKIAAVLPALKVFFVPRVSAAYVRAVSQEAGQHLRRKHRLHTDMQQSAQERTLA